MQDSSERRSTSGVRDLLAVFENGHNHTGDRSTSADRGRSPTDSSSKHQSDASSDVPRRKVRASFIPVDLIAKPTTLEPVAGAQANKMSGTTNPRRPSFSFDGEQDQGAINELKKTVSEEKDRRKSIPMPEVIPETAASSSLPTPIPEEALSSAKKPFALPTRLKDSENTEKVASAEGGEADVAVVGVTSGKPSNGPIDKPGTTDKVTKESSKAKKPVRSNGTPKSGAAASTAPNGKAKEPSARPAAISASRPAQKVPSTKSPATLSPASPGAKKFPRQSVGGAKSSTKESTEPSEISRKTIDRLSKPRTSTGSTSSRKAEDQPHEKPRPKSPTRPVTLSSHLTAPTASSAAKHEREPDKDKASASSRKPKELSAHLLAPTASSAAKHDSQSQPSVSAKPAPTRKPATTQQSDRGNVTKPTTSSLSASRHSTSSRTSLAPQNTNSSAPKSAPGEGFLARMTKPTAASNNKVQGKVEEPSVAPSTGRSRASSTKSKPTNETNGVANTKAAVPKSKSSTNSDAVSKTSKTEVPQGPKAPVSKDVKDQVSKSKSKKPAVESPENKSDISKPSPESAPEPPKDTSTAVEDNQVLELTPEKAVDEEVTESSQKIDELTSDVAKQSPDIPQESVLPLTSANEHETTPVDTESTKASPAEASTESSATKKATPEVDAAEVPPSEASQSKETPTTNILPITKLLPDEPVKDSDVNITAPSSDHKTDVLSQETSDTPVPPSAEEPAAVIPLTPENPSTSTVV